MSGQILPWSHLKTTDFASLDPARTIALLPVGAVEQHGPHLPLGTDTIILEALIARLAPHLPDALTVLVLPTQAVGDSLEHSDFDGTLSHAAESLIDSWTTLGRAVASTGLTKMAIVNSHGGQPQIVDIVAQRLRHECGLLAARIKSYRLGTPDGAFDADELAYGYHGGEVETSLMLAIAPELVAMDKAQDFDTLARRMAQDNQVFQVEGSAGFAWAAQDLNGAGAMGNAAAADALRGERTLALMAERLAIALGEIADFPMDHLADGPA